jgi:branched-chain amino acid transport system permease protein
MRWIKIGFGVVLMAFLLIAPHILGPFYLRVVTEILIWGVLAMAINILVGYTGLAPFGQAGIFGTAAYVVGYMVVKADLTAWYLTVPAGILGATLISVIFGIIAIRTTGLYFLMITLAEGMVVWGLAYRWAAVTGAENGLRGISRPEFLGTFSVYYYVVLAVVVLVTLAMYRVVHSPFGLTLQGIREGERRMRALGYNVPLHKFIAFVLAGFFSGIAGVLYVYYNNFVSPSAVEFSRSAEELLMVILGGPGTFAGPIIGSAIITFVRHQVSLFTDRWLMILGAIYVIVILVAPGGLVRGARQLADWARERRAPATSRGVSPPSRTSPARAARKQKAAPHGTSPHGTPPAEAAHDLSAGAARDEPSTLREA